jgi:hypothetical protein
LSARLLALRRSCRSIASPHPGRDALLLLAHGIGIDRRGGELGMPQPSLDEIERKAGGHGRHPEAVPQAFGAGVRTVQPGRFR